MDALKVWLRRGLFAFGALAALAGVAYGGVHLYTESALKAPPPPVAFGQLPAGDAGEGARLAHVLGCRACHTPDLGGQVMDDIPHVARIVAPNLTRRRDAYDQAAFLRLMRTGTKADGRLALVMPNKGHQRLTDAQLADLFVYLHSVPVVDRELPPFQLRLLARLGIVLGKYDLEELRADAPESPAVLADLFRELLRLTDRGVPGLTSARADLSAWGGQLDSPEPDIDPEQRERARRIYESYRAQAPVLEADLAKIRQDIAAHGMAAGGMPPVAAWEQLSSDVKIALATIDSIVWHRSPHELAPMNTANLPSGDRRRLPSSSTRVARIFPFAPSTSTSCTVSSGFPMSDSPRVVIFTRVPSASFFGLPSASVISTSPPLVSANTMPSFSPSFAGR